MQAELNRGLLNNTLGDTLVNETDGKCRALVGKVVCELLQQLLPSTKFAHVAQYAVSWLRGTEPLLKRAAAQVLGLLVDVAGAKAATVLQDALPPLRAMLEHAPGMGVNDAVDDSPDAPNPGAGWPPIYYGLLLVEKAVVALPQTLAEAADAPALWEAAAALLLHPHLWVRKAAGRLVGHYLARCDTTGHWAGGGVVHGGGLLAGDGRLMTLARAVCQQVETPALDDAMGAQVVKNLVGLVRIALARGPPASGEPAASTSTTAAATADDEDDSGDDEDREAEQREADTAEAGEAGGSGRAWVPKEVEWVFKRMGRAAANGTDTQRTTVLLWCAAATAALGDAGVSPVLYDLLRPVLRANSGTGYSAAVKQKAEEVLALVQETVGGARMASCYAALRGSKERAREGKRKYLKLQAVLDPEATARRRIRKGEKNRVQKKRKMDHVTAHKGKSMRRDVGSGVMRKN
jgi:U3 small nucleolar RNA-associated protein 20